MITKEYKVAAAEVNKILSYLPAEEIQMIPENLRNFLNEIEDKDAIVDINLGMASLYDQAVSQKAKEILAMIYTYYFTELEDLPDIEPKVVKEAKKAYNEIKTQSEDSNMAQSNDSNTTLIPKVPWYKKLLLWLKIK